MPAGAFIYKASLGKKISREPIFRFRARQHEVNSTFGFDDDYMGMKLSV